MVVDVLLHLQYSLVVQLLTLMLRTTNCSWMPRMDSANRSTSSWVASGVGKGLPCDAMAPAPTLTEPFA